jgi:riboflavin biosynthesis pyrimidine reductase
MSSSTMTQALEVLFESRASRAGSSLPSELSSTYGGDLMLDDSVVYGNMVATIDGIAAERTRLRSSRDISGGDPSDRFVMGLLRAHADAVVIGAGTLRAHPGGAWTADAAYPDAAPAFAAFRDARGRERPTLVVLSESGDVRAHPGLDGAIVMTSERGVDRLSDDVTEHADVRVVPSVERGLDVATAIEQVRSMGHRRILTEGGPRLIGSLIDARAIEELFLTVSPLIAGRAASDTRPGIVDGLELRAGEFAEATLRSVRRSGSLLFLRYRLTDRLDDENHTRKEGRS